MPRRNRNKKFYKNNSNENNYQSSNNKGISHKWTNKNKNSRKIVLKPSQIDFIGDSRSNEQAPLSKNRNRVLENLKDMGLANTKLSIGDTDQEIRKALLESRPHCKLGGVPDDVFSIIVGYVQKYFSCYDCNREGLLSAYNSKVTFSLCLNMNSQRSYRSFRFEDAYYRDNRNLRRLVGREGYHEEKRSRLLHHGKIDTVNLITKLPPTEHDPASFRLDCCYFSVSK
ncbi:nuclear RNA export factor 1 isoform X2 [Brachionus plicatilis]|uniref:Nuclear RNA export factor 1 isoform X2 n=1 Tax=Brachionus plicatilis TaxID=10195 RepID=A0A3M7RMA5_BRAPC|nr:nuclear RNA export factor 1 isoform X2 [Brachionus plicatilis]